MQNRSPIAWNRVAELRDEIGDDEFAEVVELFLEEVDAMVAELSEAPEPELEERLHAIKGSALNLGFEGFAELCQLGESSAAAGRGGDVDRTSVATIYHMSREVFLAGLDGEADT
ncbi:MAG: Hpt domain-containing protein [Pseudomonadota bacterium]